MEYEVVQDRDGPDAWRVEAIDYTGEGEIYIAVFYGPRSKERAEEYAAWKTANESVNPILVSK